MLTKDDLIKFGRSLDEDHYFFGDDYLELKAEEWINSQNSGKPIVSGSLPLVGSEIISKAIDRSRDLNRDKFDGTSFRMGYIAGFEDAQSIAVGGNDR